MVCITICMDGVQGVLVAAYFAGVTKEKKYYTSVRSADVLMKIICHKFTTCFSLRVIQKVLGEVITWKCHYFTGTTETAIPFS